MDSGLSPSASPGMTIVTAQISSANLDQTRRSGRTAVHKGRVVFGAMDEVVFGRHAAEAVVEQLDRLGAKRAFLMVSGTLNRETREIENIRNVMGARCAGIFDEMPA